MIIVHALARDQTVTSSRCTVANAKQLAFCFLVQLEDSYERGNVASVLGILRSSLRLHFRWAWTVPCLCSPARGANIASSVSVLPYSPYHQCSICVREG